MKKLAIVLILMLMMLSIPMIVAVEESEPVYKRVGICKTLRSGRTWCYWGRITIIPGVVDIKYI